MRVLLLAQCINLMVFILYWVINFSWDNIAEGIATHLNYPTPYLSAMNFLLITGAKQRLKREIKEAKGGVGSNLENNK